MADHFAMSVDTDNDAFVSEGNQWNELARILRDLADRLESWGENAPGGGNLFDCNGNRCGVWTWLPAKH